MASFNITVLPVGALPPTTSDAALMEAAAMKKKLELMDGEYASKMTLIGDAIISIGMRVDSAKSFIVVEDADDGGMLVKVECSYKLMPLPVPVPSVEAQAEAQDETGDDTHEMGGGAANNKVKQD